MAPKKYFLLCILLILLTGCGTGLKKRKAHFAENTRIQNPEFPAYKAPGIEEGSLWSEISGISLFPDRRARRVGDIVTVRIVEDPEAKLEATTKATRSSSIQAKMKFLGYMAALAEKNPRLADDPGTDDLANATLSSKFDGKGSSDRAGHVKAYISAVVVKVRPNGNLHIRGKREIKVNNETEYITISGLIRAEDISPANEIASTFVANAKITYSGIGPVSEKQKPGWLGRAMDYVWPF